jgi:uncharacterized protein YcfJ
METTQATTRIHPLLAGAAVSVTLVSLLGVAALSGMLPNSNSSAAPMAQAAPAAVLVQTPAGLQYMQPVSAPVAVAYQVVPVAPPATKPAATVRRPSSHQPTYAQNSNNYRSDNRQPTYQQPVPAANSPIGIATGAVVGGLIGNQVGGGRGRTLATVAGAVGGGFLGNIAGQKYGY